MKKASTLVTVIIALVVLLGALGVGFSVKQYRVSKAKNKPAVKGVVAPKPVEERGALPGGGRSNTAPGDAGRFQRREDRAQMNEQMANMSEEERQAFRDDMRQRFSERRDSGDSSDRQPGGMRMSDEERQRMRERFENMSEEERQAFREEMRQRMGGRRRGGQRGQTGEFGPGDRADGPGGEPPADAPPADAPEN
ncbi:MAG: hypothetical protein JW720_01475 [Sedimentisphaerales bacterium]|nr:hypothetical protein [Sedimentisphaerales bacterium]